MQDLRLAFRALRATPVVSFVAALSLALGIGANTAIFSMINSLFLRTLPVRDPDRLVLITDGTAAGLRSWTYSIWDQIRQRRRSSTGPSPGDPLASIPPPAARRSSPTACGPAARSSTL